MGRRVRSGQVRSGAVGRAGAGAADASRMKGRAKVKIPARAPAAPFSARPAPPVGVSAVRVVQSSWDMMIVGSQRVVGGSHGVSVFVLKRDRTSENGGAYLFAFGYVIYLSKGQMRAVFVG